ncbi:MAG: DUF1292 domain-containing protein [Firmicutes bacterium]|nr:DUF1292 domain-containing protein [Bacillota bacterium]
MEIVNDEKFVIEKDGKEVECDILFTFESDDTNKIYVGYTDHSIGNNGRKNIFVGAYDRLLGKESLEEIKTEEEMKMVQEVLEQIDRETN